MSRINKHLVLQEWVQNFTQSNYLYFEYSDAYPGIRTIVPNYGEYLNKTDICGFKYKSYTFVFIGYETIDTGTSDVNTNNMALMDEFLDWIEEQQKNRNFPDFGENCSEYELEPLQNMANLAMVTDDNVAKYMFGVRINYREE